MPIEVNDDRLRELIVEIERDLSGSGIRNALSQAGDVGLKEARSLVPVKTGALRDSIYANVISDDTLAIGAKADYSAYVEYGTERQGAQPFIEPAARAAAAALEQIITSLVLGGDRRGRPVTTGSGTYTPTGNKVGRPSTKKSNFADYKEPRRPKGQHRYVSKRKSTSGKNIYYYGPDQPRLRTRRIKRSDRRVRGSGRANRGE